MSDPHLLAMNRAALQREEPARLSAEEPGLPAPAEELEGVLPLIEEIRARVTDIIAHESELAQRERHLAQRADDIEAREAQCALTRAELDAARARQRQAPSDEVARRLASIVQRSRDLVGRVRHAEEDGAPGADGRSSDCANRAADADAAPGARGMTGRAELQRRRQELEALADELEDRQNALSAAQDQLERERCALDARLAEQAAVREANAAERAELDGLRRQLLERGARRDGDGAPRRGESAAGEPAGRAELSKQQMTLDERERELAARDDERRARDAQLAEQLEPLTTRERELVQKRASVDKLYLQAIETKQRALQQLETVRERQRELDERDAQVRDAGLQLAVEREQLDQARAGVEERRRAQERGTADPAGPPRAARSGAGSRWARMTAVAVALGLSAGGAWWQAEAPRFDGVARLQLGTARVPARSAFAEHAAAWSRPGFLSPDARLLWSRVDDDGLLTLRWDRPVEASELRDALERYRRDLAVLPSEHWLTPDLIARRDELVRLEAQLDELAARRAEIIARRDAQPAFAQWDAARARLDETRALIDALGRALLEARATLHSAQSVDEPRGHVTPDAVAAAQAEDAVYQEDLKELASEWRKYRTELALALVMVDEPVRELRGAIRELHDALAEQNGLQPQQAARRLLEDAAVRTVELDTLVAEYAQAWDQRRQRVERAEAGESTSLELITQQTEATEASRRITAAARASIEMMNKAAAGLGESGDSSTREVVVAALLRSHLNALSQRVDALVERSAATDPLTNFKLDAHDRQLRGLQTRLQTRREAIRDELQLQFDELARTDRTGVMEKASRRIVALEQQRDALTAQVVEDVSRLRSVESQADALRRAQLELEDVETRLDRESLRRCELAEIDAAGPAPDTVELLGFERVAVGSEHRAAHAAYAGIGAFALTMTIAGLAGAGRR